MLPLTDIEFQTLTHFVSAQYGINLDGKRTLVESRLSFDIERRGFRSYSQYIHSVMKEPEREECQRMINRLSTNYTFFFREPAYLDILKKDLAPKLSEMGKTAHIWCAGCATGEEPYSMAMTLESYNFFAKEKLSYQILATDINTDVLETAKMGVYSIDKLDAIPTNCKAFLKRENNSFQISEKIRNNIEWRYENLLNSSHMGAFEIVSCRNVLIYFSHELREKMIMKFYNALKKDGVLFMSATEGVGINSNCFTHMKRSIYKKR